MIPGTKGEVFHIKIDKEYFKKGDILTLPNNEKVKVLKVYKNTLWRRFLLRLGFKVKLFDLKVIQK